MGPGVQIAPSRRNTGVSEGCLNQMDRRLQLHGISIRFPLFKE